MNKLTLIASALLAPALLGVHAQPSASSAGLAMAEAAVSAVEPASAIAAGTALAEVGAQAASKAIEPSSAAGAGTALGKAAATHPNPR